MKACSLIVLAASLCGTALAQGTQSSSPAKAVTLHDLLVDALNNNLELRAKRLDPVIQANRLSGAWGSFDPIWSSSYTYLSSEKPQTASMTSSIFGNSAGSIYEENVEHMETGVAGRLSFGLQYQLASSVDKSDNTYNRMTNAKFHPEVITSATLTLVQPLLRDFGRAANLAEVRLQKSAQTASIHDLQGTLLRILRDVSTAYFEMVFAQENVRVKQEAVAVAENLVKENQRRVDEGRMAAIDVTQAQSRLSEAKEELLLARNFMAQRRNTLLEMTRDNLSGEEPEFVVDKSFIKTEAPVTHRASALGVMFENNPSYLASVELAKSEDVRLAYARNQIWPRVDLKGTFGYNGLDQYFDRSFMDFKDRKQPTWSAGVVVNVPVGNKTAKSRLAEAKNRQRQAIFALKRAEVTLLSAFDTALRDISNAAERTKLVKDSVALAQAAADAETKRLASGKTTSYNVSQALRDLSQAQSRELATQVDLNKAILQLQFILGTLPQHLRLNIETPKS